MADNGKFSALKTLFENYLKGFADNASTSLIDDELFEHGLRNFMEDLLNRLDGSRNGLNAGKITPSIAHPTALREVYEYLRGFKLEIIRGAPVLKKCIRHKRNSGLFYTPQRIVSYIVSNALAAVNSDSLYDLKILDPAVGAGPFLTESLRMMTLKLTRNKVGFQRIEEIKARFREKGFNIDVEVALRVYLIENCLYGVDQDPIAVQIARAALTPLPVSEAASQIKWNLRIGNSLIGEIRSSQSSAVGGDKDPSSKLFNWEDQFPEIWSDRNGFHLIVCNPPYEIVSQKESGLADREAEQLYFRLNYSTCRGKINTYRLMLERSLDLLAPTGVMGFIVPVTLQADYSADKIRRRILKETRLLKMVIIPENARAFPGVTQGLVIIIAQKGGSTRSIRPVVWNDLNEDPCDEESSPPVAVTNFRIPIITAEEDKKLLEVMDKFPPLGGDGHIPRAAEIHQGEINLTVHRDFISIRPTAIPLVRGEHIQVFQLNHPAKRDRLDWVLPELFEDGHQNGRGSCGRMGSKSEHRFMERIVIGRVVNMHTERRLKAVLIKPGICAGDMTNYMTRLSESKHYLLGILNSKLLNHRFKLTSTNNYISATELAELPLPRIVDAEETQAFSGMDLEFESLESAVKALKSCYKDKAVLKRVIESAAKELSQDPQSSQIKRLGIMNAMDAAVLLLYEADSLLSMFEKG